MVGIGQNVLMFFYGFFFVEYFVVVIGNELDGWVVLQIFWYFWGEIIVVLQLGLFGVCFGGDLLVWVDLVVWCMVYFVGSVLRYLLLVWFGVFVVFCYVMFGVDGVLINDGNYLLFM